MQNRYNLAERGHDDVVDFCTARRDRVRALLPACAATAGRRRPTGKLAWLLGRSPVVLPIPGTLSLDHLRENLAALELDA